MHFGGDGSFGSDSMAILSFSLGNAVVSFDLYSILSPISEGADAEAEGAALAGI